MNGDPLDKFRKKPVSAPGENPPPKTPDEYVAFDAKDSVDRLRIRRANDLTRAPGYNSLLDVVYDSQFGTQFTLVFTFMMVFVHGRNLQPVIAALEMGTADFIQEYDSNRWPMPKDDKAPLIESIKIVEGETGSSSPQSEKSSKEKQPGLNLH
jgi:hypothetical protein